jgi:LCP family protein required for cell wall assembly
MTSPTRGRRSARGRSIASAGPAERRRGGRRRRDPLWARLLVIIGAVLMLGSGVTIVGGKMLLDRYAGAVNQQNLLGGAAATDGHGHARSIDGALNLLLVGIDERPGDSASGARSDSVIIAHISASHDQAFLVSIPRDSLVDIPAYPRSHYRGGTDKINAAFAFGYQNGGGRSGGFQLLALTIKQLTGISFNGGAIVNFGGFQSLIGALGGVDMCVDEKTISVHVGHDRNGNFHAPYQITSNGAIPIRGITPQVYQPGCQHLAAWQALDYVRQRELISDGDYGRQRHQQQFLKAVVKKATSAGIVTNPVALDQVLRAGGQAVTFDGGGSTIQDWIFTLKGIGSGGVTMLKTNGGKFNSKTVRGQSAEVLSEVSLQLFADVRRDDVAGFVAAHPDWVASDATGL